MTSCSSKIPDAWNEYYKKGNFEMQIDAKIICTESHDYSVYTVAPLDFDPRMCVDLLNHLVGGVVIDALHYGDMASNKLDDNREIQYGFYQNYIFYQSFTDGIIQLENWILPGEAYPGEPAGTTLENIDISEEAASNIGYELLDAFDIDYMQIADASKARVLTSSYQTLYEGWYISFCRDYAHYTPISIASVSNNRHMMQRDFPPKSPWLPETISMFINGNGIQAFYWGDPIEILYKTEINENLLSFSDMQDIIKEYFFNNYLRETMINSKRIPKVFKIVLTGAMLSDETNGSGRIIPTWAVFYTTEAEIENYSLPAVVCFDATTGQPVNPFSIEKGTQ